MEVDQARIDKGMYWNQALSLVEGCTPCGSECRKCWSAEQTHRRRNHPTPKTKARYSGLTNDAGKFNGTVRFMEADLLKPLKTRRPRTWAVWNDLFHPDISDECIGMAWSVMGLAGDDTFLVLTKRPDRANQWLSDIGSGHLSSYTADIPGINRYWASSNMMLSLDGPCSVAKRPLRNVYLGTTCGHPDSLWRLEELLKCPAAKRFVSCEPLLGELELLSAMPILAALGISAEGEEWGPEYIRDEHGAHGIDWLVIGPETGRNARPSKPEWFESLIGQADAAGIPVFVKAFPVGDKVSKNMADWPAWARRREFLDR